MLTRIASISILATATQAEELSKDELLDSAMLDYLNLKYTHDASDMWRQSPIDIQTDRKGYPLVTYDEAFHAQFASKVSFANIRKIKNKAFDVQLVGDNMEFKTSLSQFWFPEVDPISFTPAQFHFHKGMGKYVTTSKDNGSEHTLNGKHFDLEMHIVNLNLDKKT